MVKIFISHNTKDARFVSGLKQYLIKNKIVLYIADRDRQPGKYLPEKNIKNP